MATSRRRPPPRRQGASKPKGGIVPIALGAVAVIAIYVFFQDDGGSGGGSSSSNQALRDIPAPSLASYASWGAAAQDDDSDAAPVLEASLLRTNYYVVYDGSGSMGESRCSGDLTKEQAAKQALEAFAAAVPADANLGLLAFDSAGVTERVPLGIDNREDFNAALQRVRSDSETPLGQAIGLAYQRLLDQAQRQLGYGEYNLVVVTDGEASDINTMNTNVRNILSGTPITIHTIGFCIDESHALNLPEHTFYRSAMAPEELLTGLEAVLAESPDFQVTDFES